MDECQACLGLQPARVDLGIVEGVAVQDDVAASRSTACTLMAGVVWGITIIALTFSLAAASATPWAWLPAEAQMTPRSSRPRSTGHLVVGAADLEREDRLKIFPLQVDRAAEPLERRGIGSSGLSIATS